MAHKQKRKEYQRHWSNQQLNKKCREHNVKHGKSKNETIDILLKIEFSSANEKKEESTSNKKKQNKIKNSKKKNHKKHKKKNNRNSTKKKHKALEQSVSSLEQSAPISLTVTDLCATVETVDTSYDSKTVSLNEINDDQDDIHPQSNIKDIVSNKKSRHNKKSSIIKLGAQTPKKMYPINDMRCWNEVKDVKAALPINFTPAQIKLFYKGKELNDDDTLEELNIVDDSNLRLLLDWNSFKPDSDQPPQEHIHMNLLKEIKKVNDFKYFSTLVNDVLIKKYGIKFEYRIDRINPMRVLHEYCICLSGDRKMNGREWTELHSICYDYQNNVGDVEDVLKRTNLYIDTWTHSDDTALRLAINNHSQNENLIALVEFLILNGARRMIRHTVVNLKREKHDALYKEMKSHIRLQLIELLEPYINQDPFKGEK